MWVLRKSGPTLVTAVAKSPKSSLQVWAIESIFERHEHDVEVGDYRLILQKLDRQLLLLPTKAGGTSLKKDGATYIHPFKHRFRPTAVEEDRARVGDKHVSRSTW